MTRGDRDRTRRSARVWAFDRDEARRHLGDVGRLWAWWLAGLMLLVLLDGGALAVAGLLTLVGVVVLLRPLQQRALRHERDPGPAAGQIATALGRGHQRDVLLRELAYGVRPFSAALDASGANPNWVWVRHGVVVLSVAGLVLLLVELFAL